jgi:hypothetical protein
MVMEERQANKIHTQWPSLKLKGRRHNESRKASQYHTCSTLPCHMFFIISLFLSSSLKLGRGESSKVCRGGLQDYPPCSRSICRCTTVFVVGSRAQTHRQERMLDVVMAKEEVVEEGKEKRGQFPFLSPSRRLQFLAASSLQLEHFAPLLLFERV